MKGYFDVREIEERLEELAVEEAVDAEAAGLTVGDEEAAIRVEVYQPDTAVAVVGAVAVGVVVVGVVAAVEEPGDVAEYPDQGILPVAVEDVGLAGAEEVVEVVLERTAEEQEAAEAVEVACSPKPYLAVNEVVGSLVEAEEDGCFHLADT